MYDIMKYVEALFVPPSGAFLVLVKCVVELGVNPLCTLYHSDGYCVFDIGGTPMMICTCHYRMDGLH